MKALALIAVLGGTGATGALTFAQTTPEVFSWMTGSVVSVLGGAVVAFLRGWVVGGTTHERVVQERDALSEELRARNKEDRELLIPALIRNTEALTRLIQEYGDGQAKP